MPLKVTPPMTSHGRSRRQLVAQIAGLSLLPAAVSTLAAQGEAPASRTTQPLTLPLKLSRLIHHIGISVRDVVASATFYSRLVGGQNVHGETEPFLRYFIQLQPGSLGDVAIGKLGTLGSTGKTIPLIDHFCIDAVPYDDAAWRARLAAEGLTYLAQGVFADKDGIAIQVAGGEGGESLSAGEVTQHKALYTGKPLIQPRGYDHLMLRVTDIRRTAAFWERMFGVASRMDGEIAWLHQGTTRIGLRRVSGSEAPGVDYFAIRAATFDTRIVAKGLAQLDATNISEGPSGTLRFRDIDGLQVQLVAK